MTIRSLKALTITAILLSACEGSGSMDSSSSTDFEDHTEATDLSHDSLETPCMSSVLATRIETFGKKVNKDIFPAFQSQITLAKIRCKDDVESPVCSDFEEVHEAVVPLTKAMETLRGKFVAFDAQGRLRSSCSNELYWNNVAYGNLSSAVTDFEECRQNNLCVSTAEPADMDLTIASETGDLVLRAEQYIKTLEIALTSRKDSMRQ